MLSRIAVFELRMYFLPGLYALVLSSILLKVAFQSDPLSILSGSPDLTQSLIFVSSAYFLGHLAQTIAHGIKIGKRRWGPEECLKRKYWGGSFPSELALFKNAGIIDEFNRETLIENLVRDGLLKTDQSALFDAAPNKEGKRISQGIFNRMHAKFPDQEDSGVKTAESYYQMLRAVAVISNLMFWVTVVLLLDQRFLGNIPTVPCKNWLRSPLLLSSVLICIAWRLFRYRCRGVAEGFVRRVFLSVVRA